jgi:hypothetical protein
LGVTSARQCFKCWKRFGGVFTWQWQFVVQPLCIAREFLIGVTSGQNEVGAALSTSNPFNNLPQCSLKADIVEFRLID